MKATPKKPAEDRLPNEDDVLRRMLNTPPEPQERKPAAKKTPAKKRAPR